MRTLYFCRHAKSSWADPGQADFDRPLNERGERNAAYMADLFKERGEPVELLVSSTAVRALTTAKKFAKALGVRESELVLRPDLYHAGPVTIQQVAEQLPAHVDRALFFGHNPGITEVIERLSGEPIGNLPTCGMVRIDLPIDNWAMLSAGIGTLVWLDYPKRHPGQG
ncbi:MAG: histidine phosphatase family protein [Flavobacteriales bacterium]|nr:histidine phosphatase family protein [Flavobacteriales bacterium]